MKQFDFTAELTALLTHINDEYYNYNKQLSNIDMELSAVLHEIQNTNFSASKGYELAIKVKMLRLKRHQLKAEHSVAQKLFNTLKDKKLQYNLSLA
jgi:hypothetical protein